VTAPPNTGGVFGARAVRPSSIVAASGPPSIVTKPLLQYVNERAQNESKILVLFGMVGNNQSKFFSSMPCGKNTTTSRSPRVLGPSSQNRAEVSDNLIVTARLSLSECMLWFAREPGPGDKMIGKEIFEQTDFLTR